MKYTIKRFGSGLHIILSKRLFSEGQEVAIRSLGEEYLSEVQERHVRLLIQDELLKVKQGF